MKRTALPALLIIAAIQAAPACAQRDAAGTAAAGQSYRTEITRLAAVLETSTADAAARRALIRALMETGQYEEAEQVATAGGPAFSRLRGDALLARGRQSHAAEAYRAALTARAPDSAAARLQLALLRYDRGDRVAAMRELEWFVPFYNNAPGLTADDLVAVARAVSALGVTDPQLFHGAVKAYEQAVQEDARSVDARIAEAALFLDKFDSRQASEIISEALAIEPTNPRALLQLARAKRFDGSDEAHTIVDRALTVNPRLTAALVFKAELLAGQEDFAAARQLIARAFAVDSTSLDALALHGAIAWLERDTRAYDATRARASTLYPGSAVFLTKAADMAGQARRYTESITLARQAVDTDPTSWAALTTAGLGAFRLGRFDEAAATLGAAFKGDPFNVWVKNTLDLLDTYPQYSTRTSANFELLLKTDEADLIALYMQPLAEAAYDTFQARYRWKPSGPIRVEVYPRHADFSVRTVGLTGLGALGVAFGDILAMDSPAARRIGEFHWGSTLWHEIAHTFTLGSSRSNVPRWLTEGISGWEESNVYGGWGDGITPSFIAAYAGGMLPPLSGITPAFVRPAYPEQVMHAYEMAALVVEHIVASRGEDALRRMLAAFADGKSQVEVFRDVLRATPDQYDSEFDAHMRQRFASAIAGLSGEDGSPYAVALAAGRAAIEQGRVADAAREIERARAMFPEYGGPGSPYALMVDMAIKQNDDRAALMWLERQTQRYAQNYEAWLALASLREKTGDVTGAAAALEQAMFVHPYDPAVHERLAKLYETSRNLRGVVRERRAVVALKPVDRAAAYYQLAVALEAAGDRSGARTEVLRALEAAPGYGAAQDLLLRLQGNR